MVTLTQSKPRHASESAIRLAEQSSAALEQLISSQELSAQDSALRLTVQLPGGASVELAVPEATLPLLLSVLKELGHGRGVAVVAADSELTTQQAADILNVSRPYLIKLLDEGRMPHRSVGSRRRVRLSDVLEYKESEVLARHKGLDELVAEAQRLGMY